MERFYGVMPSDEVEIEKTLKDENGLDIILQAGPHGWSVIWPNYDYDFLDVDDTAESNMAKAEQVVHYHHARK